MKQKDLLKQVFKNRKDHNHRYNLSALARDINVSQSKLWKVIYGEELLSVEQVYNLGHYCKLPNPDIYALIEESLLRKKQKQNEL